MHTGRGLSDTVNFAWSVTGTRTITVTATNAVDMVTDTHRITINDASQGSDDIEDHGGLVGRRARFSN
jgi:hypothetical protein